MFSRLSLPLLSRWYNIEKKRNDINGLERRAKEIKQLKLILNTILANGCYSDKEMESQINTANRTGNLDDEELTAVKNIWRLRKTLTRELIVDVNVYVAGAKNNEKNKEIEKKEVGENNS